MEVPKVFHPTRSKYLVFTTDFLLPIFISLGIIATIYFMLFSAFFQVTTIDCTLDFAECQDQNIIAELAKLQNKNIFTLKTDSIVSRLTSGDFTIRAAVIKKELPGLLKVELQSVYPVVALSLTGDSNWVVLDARFRVISTTKIDPNVPTVIVSGPLTLTIGQPISDELIIQTLKLAQKLSDQLFSVKTVSLVDGDTIELVLTSGIKAIFTPKKDEMAQLRSLQTVLSDATITAGVKTIDVRFAQPVLR